MPEVGHILRKAREEKGLDLKDVERTLKIRYKFLAAFEKDQPIPELNDIYIRGFLKCYAEYLELDADRILQAYGSGPQMVQTPLRYGPTPAPSFSAMSSDKQPAEEIKRPQARPTWAMLSAAVVVIALIGFAAVSMARNASSPSSAEATAAWALTRVLEASEAISDTFSSSATPRGTPLPTATPTRTPTPTITATATLTPTPEFYTGVNIELIAKAKAWVQIRVDGNKAFEGMMEPGTRRSWRGEERVEVRCGNAGGVEAVVNGESIGLLGENGQVVDMEWVKEKGTGTQVEPPATLPANTEVSAAVTVSPAP
jgi:cytoskeletal protein RodZ